MKAKINFPAVVVAAIAHFALGAFWFSALQQQWLTGIGKTLEQLQQGAGPAWMPYLIAFAATLLMAEVLACIIIGVGKQTAIGGIKMGALMWIGFVATTFATEYVFEGRSRQIFAINAGYPLVGLMLMGAILGAWKKKEKAA